MTREGHIIKCRTRTAGLEAGRIGRGIAVRRTMKGFAALSKDPRVFGAGIMTAKLRYILVVDIAYCIMILECCLRCCLSCFCRRKGTLIVNLYTFFKLWSGLFLSCFW
jgi:hypothetical protein